jgi:ElaB/YqjD/DUF883 family membrane-anchored ribosome-binding protein
MIQDAERYSRLLQTATNEHIQTIHLILQHIKKVGDQIELLIASTAEAEIEKRKTLQAEQDELFKIVNTALDKINETIKQHNELLGVKD